MFQTKKRMVIALIAILLLVLGGCAAASTDSGSNAPASKDSLFSENFSGDGGFVSIDFKTLPAKGDIKLSYENKGPEKVNVTLQKKGWFGKWSDVQQTGSSDTFFSVDMGSTNDKTFDGASNKTYRIIIETPDGAGVSGYVKASQI